MKRIALFNDLSGFGKCSLTAAIPVISVMGIQACPMPTAVLSNQTDFDSYQSVDLTRHIDSFIDEWKKLQVSFDGIYSGYLASAEQIHKVSSFLQEFQTKDTIFLADPVMGDYGNTYDMYNDDFLNLMKELTKKANIITPNLTELCLLTDTDYAELTAYADAPDYLERIIALAESLLTTAEVRQSVIVTGIIRKDAVSGQSYVGSLAVNSESHYYTKDLYFGKGFSGTGDLFASVICASLVKGLSLEQALHKASDFLTPAIEEAVTQGIEQNHGVHFEKYLPLLISD
ncbi:MAG: pyridoxamine kinase [Lachnospiraceae bacterium]|nr:pyridoxamine kinase [Lachnospiraceae bacterium]